MVQSPASIVFQMSRHNEADRLTDFLETVRQRCEFDYWFFGHIRMFLEMYNREPCPVE